MLRGDNIAVILYCLVERAWAANSPVFGPFARGFETVR